MTASTALVTGANSGIGLATCEALAARGHRVLMLCRSRERGQEAQRRVVEHTGSSTVELILCDLSSQAQIRETAERLLRERERLELLVNNAAVFSHTRKLTEAGIELQLAVNHLAPFLLTRLLLPLLRASPPARVVTVSSDAHRHGRLDWDDLQGESGYFGLRAYSNSKLCNVLFTRELARRTDPGQVAAHAAHPGLAGTRLLYSGWRPLRLLKPFLPSPEAGARPVVHAATSPDIEGRSGLYFRKGGEGEPAPRALDPEAARRLWRISEQLTGLVREG